MELFAGGRPSIGRCTALQSTDIDGHQLMDGSIEVSHSTVNHVVSAYGLSVRSHRYRRRMRYNRTVVSDADLSLSKL